ncbi:hypothetical protein KAS14_07610 [Candidatus Bathyarchaeota archaeon]|nr:hypothetical protein [Candidatus Bathyarchaeota archaeon]
MANRVATQLHRFPRREGALPDRGGKGYGTGFSPWLGKKIPVWWVRQIPVLSKVYRMILADLPGHSQSDALPKHLDICARIACKE